ncbi:hypothetical protein FEM48_Zijuj08G0184500 [Ziziphus jujuba var. spinosa]|uniref:Retrotransposon gag domain-containing protein n=1 Tax=Ziziphus jujuba var. spinosa TaxID=714518 RepID=A0A978V0N4_ZIZJJ|nr:hypothetical protein FEM48_Zijuj08G0184500 [Ziziphus jujuba var. spinosa]
MSWLINSMDPSISKTYMFLATAQEIWEATKETFSDLGNSAQVYEIVMRIHNMKQGNLSVLQYYNTLRTLWQELNLFYDFEWHSPQDNVILKKMIKKEHVFAFLASLNNELDKVCGRILGCEVLPSTHEVFYKVRRKESKRNVMLRKETREASITESDSSALTIKSNRFSNFSNDDQRDPISPLPFPISNLIPPSDHFFPFPIALSPKPTPLTKRTGKEV